VAFFHFNFQRAALNCGRREFPLYHTASNLSREKLHKVWENKNPNFVYFAYCNLRVDVL
jgi:hypothetical protein